MLSENLPSELADLVRSFKTDPAAFLKAHPAETALLEYKAAFALDAALSLCPLVDRTRANALLNPEIILNIFITLVAFANTRGGMLVLGVAEAGREIISERYKNGCALADRADRADRLPCFEAHATGAVQVNQALNIVGLEAELAYRKMNFDAFQRYVQGLFSTNAAKSVLKFKHSLYPCEGKHAARTTRILLSEALDPHIQEIAAVETAGDGGASHLLGLVTVQRASRPIYLTIDSSDSQNRIYALPVRKTGQTELERDPRRIETYIFHRYEAKIAERIAKELANLTLAAKPRAFKPEDLAAMAAENAARWQAEGWAYPMVETFGKELRAYTVKTGLWEDESRPEVKALLLMVSIHYKAGWEIWTPRNNGNREAVKALFMALHVRQWWRTRFRVLYAMQFMDPEQIADVLADPIHADLSKETLGTIRTYVAQKTVAVFIRDVARAGLGDISRKAQEVLLEIATLWNDPVTGLDSPL